MSWQLLVGIGVLTSGVSVLLQRTLMKDDKSDPFAYSVVFQLLTGLLIGAVALLRGFSAPDIMPLLPNLLLMTLLYGSGNVFMFTALKYIEASDFTIVFASRALWTIIAAVAFLKETFNMSQALGAILILTSIVIVTSRTKIFSLDKGHIYALLAAIAFGLAFANDAYILRGFDLPSYLFIAFVTPALVVWVFKPKATKQMKPLLQGKTPYKLILLATLYAASYITVFWAYQVGRNSAQIASLYETSIIVTVILGIVFLKERADLLKKLVGLVVSFVGVLLLS